MAILQANLWSSVDTVYLWSRCGLSVWTRALRRRHCVGGGAQVNFSRRRRRDPDPIKLAAEARRRPKSFFKDSRKISFYPQNFLMTFFRHLKLQKNKYTATMASAARRQIIGGGTRRSTKVGGGGGAHKLSAALVWTLEEDICPFLYPPSFHPSFLSFSPFSNCVFWVFLSAGSMIGSLVVLSLHPGLCASLSASTHPTISQKGEWNIQSTKSV